MRYEDFLPAMILDMRRAKNSRQTIFDLKEYPLLIRALAAVPEVARQGAAAVNDHGTPFQRRFYNLLYCELADARGIPKGV